MLFLRVLFLFFYSIYESRNKFILRLLTFSIFFFAIYLILFSTWQHFFFVHVFKCKENRFLIDRSINWRYLFPLIKTACVELEPVYPFHVRPVKPSVMENGRSRDLERISGVCSLKSYMSRRDLHQDIVLGLQPIPCYLGIAASIGFN